MFSTTPNWIGLLVAAALFAMVLAVAPFVAPRGQTISSPDQVAACDGTMFYVTDLILSANRPNASQC